MPSVTPMLHVLTPMEALLVFATTGTLEMEAIVVSLRSMMTFGQ